MSWLSQTPHARSSAHNPALSTLEKKRHEIREELLFHADNHRKRFVCESDVHKLWSAADLVEIFPRWPRGDIERLRQLYIVSFTILVFIGWPIDGHAFRAIFLSRDSHVDARLPFGRQSLTGLGEQFVDLFEERQYIFKPCIIRKSRQAHVDRMDINQPMPFIDVPEKIGWGGYGEVWKATIAPSCYAEENEQNSMINGNEKVVAYKHFRDGRNYDKEVRSLDILRESLINHEHIAVHLAAFVHGENDFYIFFELTRLGDLEVLLNGGAEPNDYNSADAGVFKYEFGAEFPEVRKVNFVEELANITSALEFLHETLPRTTPMGVYCAHMDLRPKNILIYPRRTGSPNIGRWVLADFGISSFKYREPGEKSYSFQTIGDFAQSAHTDVTGPHNLSGTHRAPELHELSTIKRYPGRKCDIWSLGCIANEVLAFILGGLGDSGVTSAAQALRDFRLYKKQKYFDDYWFEHETPGSRRMAKAKLRTSVVNWLTRVPGTIAQNQPEHAEWVLQFVDLLYRILEIDPNRRPLASNIVLSLQDIIRNMKDVSDLTPWASPTLGTGTDDMSVTGSQGTTDTPLGIFAPQPQADSSSNDAIEDMYGTSPSSFVPSSSIDIQPPTSHPRLPEQEPLYEAPFGGTPPLSPFVTRLRSSSTNNTPEATSPSGSSYQDVYSTSPGSAGPISPLVARLRSSDRAGIPEIAVQSSSSEGSTSDKWSLSTGQQQATPRSQSPSSTRNSGSIARVSRPEQSWTFKPPPNIRVFEIAPAGDKAAFVHSTGTNWQISILDLTQSNSVCQTLNYVDMPSAVNWDRLAFTSRYMVAAGKIGTRRNGVMLDLAEGREIRHPKGWPWPCQKMTPSSRGIFAWIESSHTVRLWNPRDNTEITKSVKQDIDHICFNTTGTCLFIWARDQRTHSVHTLNMLDPYSPLTHTRFEASLSRPGNRTSMWAAQSDHACLVQEASSLRRCYIRSDEGSLAPPQEIPEAPPNAESSATALCDDCLATVQIVGKIKKHLKVSMRYFSVSKQGQFNHVSNEIVLSRTDSSERITFKGSFKLAAFSDRHVRHVVVVTQSGGVWRFENIPNASVRQRHGSFLT